MNLLIPILLNIIRYLLIAGGAFLIFYKLLPTYFWFKKIQLKTIKQKDLLRELTHSTQTTIVIAFVGVLILSSPLKEFVSIYTDYTDYPIWWIPISIIVMLIIHDTYFYWMHRIVHHPKLFKRVHLIHHRSTNPTPFTSYSFHIYEGLLEALIAPILLFTLPLHPIAIVSFSTISFLFNVYGHLGYEIAPLWFRRSLFFKVLNTSTHHNLHHSKAYGNYGLYFRFWDKLMKTEHPKYISEYDAIQKRRISGQKQTKVSLN